jgi:hypothetical protein|tara:strand:- start:9730 stop:9849 length:120 start_codon:yes stop_codon:yes gene_type:complete
MTKDKKFDIKKFREKCKVVVAEDLEKADENIFEGYKNER